MARKTKRTTVGRLAKGCLSPEAFFVFWMSRIRREWIVCFASAFIVGVVTHFYKFVNWLPNWDSLVFRCDWQNMTVLGRWFLAIACFPSSAYDLPWVCSILILVYLSLAAVCICVIFRLKTPIAAALVGGLTTSFPTVTSTLTYNYVADGYSLAMLFAVLSALLFTIRNHRTFLPAVVLLALSLGIYQPYVSVTMMLLLLYQIEHLVFCGDYFKDSMRRAGRFLLGGLCAAAVYVVCLKIALFLNATELSDYLGGGSDEILTDPLYLPRVLWASLNTLVKFFVDFRRSYLVYPTVNALGFLGFAYFTLHAAREHVFRTPARMLSLIAYVALLPICACPLYLLDRHHDYHNLMTMGFLMIPVFFMTFYERRIFVKKSREVRKNWAVLALGALLIYNFVLLANISYHKLQLAFFSSFGEAVRIADRIEQTPGANTCWKLAVLGVKPDSAKWSAHVLLDVTGVTDGSLLRPDDNLVNQSVITATLNDYCQKDLHFATIDERRALSKDPRVKAMPLWPDPGSVAVVDDFIVLRLSAGVGLYD